MHANVNQPPIEEESLADDISRSFGIRILTKEDEKDSDSIKESIVESIDSFDEYLGSKFGASIVNSEAASKKKLAHSRSIKTSINEDIKFGDSKISKTNTFTEKSHITEMIGKFYTHN